MEIPELLHDLFWDVDINDVDLINHQNYVILRVMIEGSDKQIEWLTSTIINQF
jgi:hypothetical protein